MGDLVLALVLLYALVGTVYCFRMLHHDDGREKFDAGLAFFFLAYVCVVLPLAVLADLGRRLANYADGQRSS